MTKKKKISFIVIAIIIVLVIVFINSRGDDEDKYTTQTTERMTLKQTVDVTGSVESANDIKLNFKRSGRIDKTYIDVGDEVSANQKLAQLEANDLRSQITDANARLNQARADYNKLLAGASSEDIEVSKRTVEQREQELKNAYDNLDNIEAKKQVELNNYREAAITKLENEVVVVSNALNEIENTLNDPDAEDTLAVKKPNSLDIAWQFYDDAENGLLTLSPKIASINKQTADEEILELLEEGRDLMNTTLDGLNQTLIVLDNTLTSSKLSETELDTLKANVQSDQSSLNSAKSGLQTAKSNWTNQIAYYENQVNSAENSVQSAIRSLEIAKSQLRLKESPPRDFEIEAAKARVAQAQASVDLAYANLEETIIRAPIKGTITKVNFEEGEQSSLNTPAIEMISASNLEIEVNIPESDIAKVAVGQEAEITLDAFGSEKPFSGKVTFIDPAETQIQDVVYYQVKVQFDDISIEKKPGMTANVIICTNKKENVLVVPARAVKTDGQEKYVQVLENKEIKRIEVETGLRGDSGIEITSGLKDGQEVVTFIKNGD